MKSTKNQFCPLTPNSRSYLNRWIQPDNIIPNIYNPLDLDSFAYVRNNPINSNDPTGHTPWYIKGWDDSYKQTQTGNTCAVVSIAVSLSILTGQKYTQGGIQPMFPHTYDRYIDIYVDKSTNNWTWPLNPNKDLRHVNIAIGVIPLEQQALINTMFPGRISASQSQGTRNDLLTNLNNGCPTLVTLAFANENVGHVTVAVGYDPATGKFQFFDPAYGDVVDEDTIVARWDGSRGFKTFDELWAASNLVIPNNSMVTLQKVDSQVPDLTSGGGGGGSSGSRKIFC